MPMTLEEFAQERIEGLQQKNRLRKLQNIENISGVEVIKNGKRLVSFCGNDYLGLSQHPQVIKAAMDAARKYGTGAGASRLVTGNFPLYDEIEHLLAEMKQTESACVFGSGYLANIGAIPVLVGKGDLIIADRLVHSCIYAGVNLSGADLRLYKHNDLANLKSILEKYRIIYQNCLIITETVFSMDGDVAPMEGICKLAKTHNAWVMSDDAHGFGVVKQENHADIQMGTLSKAVGAYGGYICAKQQVMDYIKSSARSLIYSTALPPAIIASAIAAIKIIRDDSELCKKPLRKAQLFTKTLGLPTAQSAIVPLIVGSEKKALEISASLEKAGFLVTAIRPPTVPNNTSRLRFTFSALHKDSDIERLAGLCKDYIDSSTNLSEVS